MSQKLTIFYTSDTHSMLFPKQEPESAATLLQCASAFQKDGDTLVLDGGDTIQGSALATYLWENGQFEQGAPAVFNQLGYDYYTLGNHDFNNGYEALTRFTGCMRAQCVAANVTDHTGTLPLIPSVVHTLKNGLRVGIVGVVTEFINLWEAKENLENLTVSDPFEAARQALDGLRGRCDLTVCLYHGGYEADLTSGELLSSDAENVGCRICRELSFDILLTAHQHAETPGRDLYGTYTLQLPPNAAKYARVELERRGDGWDICSSLLTPPQNDNEAFLSGLQPMLEGYHRWRNTEIGSLAAPVLPRSKLDCALLGSPLADLCNLVQLTETGAELSCTGLTNKESGLPSELTNGDIYGAYPFSNTITVLEVGSDALMEALERSASYLDLREGKPVISQRFLTPKVEHYNYDFFAGIDYTIDLRKPVGKRISGVTVNGAPLQDRTYTLALSNYRATGTGGYSVYTRCRTAAVTAEDIRAVIISYLSEHPKLQIPHLGTVRYLF